MVTGWALHNQLLPCCPTAKPFLHVSTGSDLNNGKELSCGWRPGRAL